MFHISDIQQYNIQQVVTASYLRQVGENLEYKRADLARRMSQYLGQGTEASFAMLPSSGRYDELIGKIREQQLGRRSSSTGQIPPTEGPHQHTSAPPDDGSRSGIPSQRSTPSQSSLPPRGSIPQSVKGKAREQVGREIVFLCIANIRRKVQAEPSMVSATAMGKEPPESRAFPIRQREAPSHEFRTLAIDFEDQVSKPAPAVLYCLRLMLRSQGQPSRDLG